VHHGNLELRTLVSNTTTSPNSCNLSFTKLLIVPMHHQIQNCRNIKQNTSGYKSKTVHIPNPQLAQLQVTTDCRTCIFISDVLNNINIKDFLYTLKCHQKLKNTCFCKNLPYKITNRMYKETQANVYNNFWVYKKQTGVPLEYTLYIRVRNNDNRKAV